ncbi:MAG: histidinol-phosphate transaminase [Desulfovibrio sp.]|nr:histidinol-phosphate transaminase [Desulfovibrio sp.]
MYTASVRSTISALKAYTPGLSIDEIRQKYHLERVIKMASNENPLGVPPLAAEAIRSNAGLAFRYPRSGNPRLQAALSALHKVPNTRIICGNGSDEIIDLLLRMLCEPGKDNIACFQPCFSLYPIQAQISNIAVRRTPLNKDFSFDFEALLKQVDERTRIVFVTTPDNPSGYSPKADQILHLSQELSKHFPSCLLLLDEAYVDFCEEEKDHSLLAQGVLPDNTAFMRTFSKSFGLAGLRLGYAVVPEAIADAFWRARLPVSVNILAEEAGLAALCDTAFRTETMRVVREGRKRLTEELSAMHCTVWPSSANFLLFQLPSGFTAKDCFTTLLSQGIIIRTLQGYDLPEHLRVSIGNEEENTVFLEAMRRYLKI